MRKTFAISIFLLLSFALKSQQWSNLRQKTFSASTDTLQLDSLIVVPGSVVVSTYKSEIIPDSLYTINPIESELIIHPFLRNITDSMIIEYRVFNENLKKKYYHKDPLQFQFRQKQEFNQVFYEPESQDIFGQSGQLNKSGSISRGISFGNQQDAIVNSNMNLQLSGKLSQDLNISAAISDANIPIQPDGNSQQIQDFDKVFIKIYNEKNNLIAGDFELISPNSYFLKINKKAKGAYYATEFNPGEKNITYKTQISAAISKGKYCRKSINVIEGNQGPYKIQGCENEAYIIILSGSEKIYIDGQLLTRGQDNDYVINYNSAEVSFTPHQPITKDKRVIIEFEYSEQNYNRFLVYNSNEISTEKSKFIFSFYNESDSKNQPLNAEFNQSQKNFLNQVGDNIDQAFYPNYLYDTIYNTNYIYYQLKDTIVSFGSGNQMDFDSIFEYSTNPDVAHYRLGFSLVGQNQGNYILSATNANGKVYQWVSPNENGTKNGSYEPVILLITPKKKQVFSVGGKTELKPVVLNYELALSNNDINTFSGKGKKDNTGFALKLSVNDLPKTNNDLGFRYKLHYEFIDQNFEAVERYRSTEFERDWNLSSQILKLNQHLLNFNARYRLNRNINTNYEFQLFKLGQDYNALKNSLQFGFKNEKYLGGYTGSLLNSQTKINHTNFYRHKTEISKNISFFKLGLKSEIENNIWQKNHSDSILQNSNAFNEWELFLTGMDSIKSRYEISYKNRQDYLPDLTNNKIAKSSLGQDFQFSTAWLKNSSKTLKTSVIYRKLQIQDTSNTGQEAENSLLGRLEMNLRFLKNTIQGNTFYEIGSGLEAVKEYSFVEVDPGLGVYIWNDYNLNKVQEIEEFEVANYKDTANYLRVELPGQYVKVYATSFNQIINLRPGRNWHKKKSFLKVLSKFNDQFAYRVNSRTKSEDIWKNINPLNNNFNSNELVSFFYSIKNTISFNRSSPVFGMDFTIQKNARQDLLIAGTNTQDYAFQNLIIRWNISQKIAFNNNLETNIKSFESDSYSTKNYSLNGLKDEVSLEFQPKLNLRISANYKYQKKENTGSEKSIENNLGSELKYLLKNSGNLNVRFNIIKLGFNGNTNSPIAYQMLEGFLPGNNLTWQIQYQQQLANALQLSIDYNGRKLPDSKVLHAGGVQIRAFF